jgi:predicted nucleic acid-binding protein
MVVVSDTTAISNLYLIDKLWLLEKLYKEVIIPSSVYQELKNLKKNVDGRDIQFEITTWIKIGEVRQKDLVTVLLLSLDRGEAEAIVLAKEMNADLLIIDELKGRKYAKQLNIEVIGLAGILLMAKKKKLISSVEQTLNELKNKAGFWISNKLFDTILGLANEKQI